MLRPSRARAADPAVAQLHQALASQSYPEAKRLAESLLRSPDPALRKEGSLRYGRILLSLGLRQEAAQYLAQMARLGDLGEDAAQLMRVYQAQ